MADEFRPLSANELESRNRWLRQGHDLFPAEYKDWLSRFFALEQSKQPPPRLAGPTSDYSESNVTTDRTYDANATTINELADILGTLISDLRQKGIVG